MCTSHLQVRFIAPAELLKVCAGFRASMEAAPQTLDVVTMYLGKYKEPRERERQTEERTAARVASSNRFRVFAAGRTGYTRDLLIENLMRPTEPSYYTSKNAAARVSVPTRM